MMLTTFHTVFMHIFNICIVLCYESYGPFHHHFTLFNFVCLFVLEIKQRLRHAWKKNLPQNYVPAFLLFKL